MPLKQYKVWHDRPNCIACGACAAVTENWIMDEADGLASPVEDELDETQLELNEEAATVCPVQIIHIAKDGDVPAYFQEKGIFTRPDPRRSE